MGRIWRAHGGAGRAREPEEVVDLRELVVEHRADLFRYARSLTRNDADAEDLAQSAVVRALAAGATLREPERAKWYLLRIVRNLATDQARARARAVGGAVGRRPRRDLLRARARSAGAAGGGRGAPARRVRRPAPQPPGGAAPPLRRRARLRSSGGPAPDHRARGPPARVPRDAGAAHSGATPAVGSDGRAEEDQPASSARAPISTDGWRRRARARASIWRTRSRLRLTSWPTSSGVRGSPRSSPKRSVRM